MGKMDIYHIQWLVLMTLLKHDVFGSLQNFPMLSFQKNIVGSVFLVFVHIERWPGLAQVQCYLASQGK